MSFIWSSVVVVSLVMLIILNPHSAVGVMFDGGVKALDLSFKLWSIYAIWLGILNILTETKLDKKLAKLMRPFVKFLIGSESQETYEWVSINLTSNIFGLGNAGIPSGINAINSMYKGEVKATSAMIMFLLINSVNIQIIPSTIIGMRILAGSKMPYDIILPIIIVSIISTSVGITILKIADKIKNKKNSKV